MNNMKKLIAIVLLMSVIGSAQAQQDVISKFFGKYQNDESFSQVNISSKMFGLFTDLGETPEDKELLNAISKLKGLKILAKEDARNARDLYKEAFSLIPKDFEELMTVRDKDKDMKFMITWEEGGQLSGKYPCLNSSTYTLPTLASAEVG